MCRIVLGDARMKCDQRLNSVEFICAKAVRDSFDCSLPFEISFKSSFQWGRGSTVLLAHMGSWVVWETPSSLYNTLSESQPSLGLLPFLRDVVFLKETEGRNSEPLNPASSSLHLRVYLDIEPILLPLSPVQSAHGLAGVPNP